MQEEQRIKLHHIIQQLAEAQADVLEASETTLMSDAKSAVYRLHSDVSEDQSLNPGIKSNLMPFLEEALSAIIGSGSSYTRAQKSHEQLIKADQYLKEQLRAQHENRILAKIKEVCKLMANNIQ